MADAGGLSEDEVLRRVRLCILDVLEVDEEAVVPGARLVEDLGANSLTLIEVMMALEEDLAVTVEERMVGEIETVSDVWALVRGLLGEGTRGG